MTCRISCNKNTDYSPSEVIRDPNKNSSQSNTFPRKMGISLNYNKSRVTSFPFGCHKIRGTLYKKAPCYRGGGCNPFNSLVPETDEHVTLWFDSLKATSFISTETHFSFWTSHPSASSLDFLISRFHFGSCTDMKTTGSENMWRIWFEKSCDFFKVSTVDTHCQKDD
jgi:hypothetical protein